jgi:hypothetical protein
MLRFCAVIQLRTQTPSLAQRKPLSSLGSLLRVRGSRPAPSVTSPLSLFVSNVQSVALVMARVNVCKPMNSAPMIRGDLALLNGLLSLTSGSSR